MIAKVQLLVIEDGVVYAGDDMFLVLWGGVLAAGAIWHGLGALLRG